METFQQVMLRRMKDLLERSLHAYDIPNDYYLTDKSFEEEVKQTLDDLEKREHNNETILISYKYIVKHKHNTQWETDRAGKYRALASHRYTTDISKAKLFNTKELAISSEIRGTKTPEFQTFLDVDGTYWNFKGRKHTNYFPVVEYLTSSSITSI